MNTRVSAWGNGLGVRIKKELAKSYKIRPGTVLEIKKHKDGILLIPVVEDKITLEWLCQDLSENEDEIWNDITPEGREELE